MSESLAESLAPIALFVYNRPQHTRRTVEALQASPLADQSDLFIFSDAPREAAVAEGVGEVRRYIKNISGFRSVVIVFRDRNFGLSRSIIDGVTRLCAERGKAIILEDDLVTSKEFLPFMNLGLRTYANCDDVMQIAGYMFPIELNLDEDALFLPFITSWGWATWDRAWRHFDPNALHYEKLRRDPQLRKRFDLNGNYPYLKMLEAQRAGRIESWAIRWYLSVFMRSGFSLFPRRTLVHNYGFDGTGVNCAVSGFEQAELDANLSLVRIPSVIEVSKHAERVMNEIPRPRRSIFSLVQRSLGFARKLVVNR